MPEVPCPIPNCEYKTPDLETAIVVALINTHALTHSQDRPSEKIRRPTITHGIGSEDWSYFLTRWEEYCKATKLRGDEKILQLLECCEEQLRKDITRAAGGTLAN